MGKIFQNKQYDITLIKDKRIITMFRLNIDENREIEIEPECLGTFDYAKIEPIE